MSHFIDILGQLATLAPYRLVVLCRSVRSFWKIGSMALLSPPSLYKFAVDTVDTPMLPLPPTPPLLFAPAALARGLALANLLLCIVATSGVLWTYSRRLACWRSLESGTTPPWRWHSRERRRCGHSDTGWLWRVLPAFLVPPRERSDTERCIAFESSYFSVKQSFFFFFSICNASFASLHFTRIDFFFHIV